MTRAFMSFAGQSGARVLLCGFPPDRGLEAETALAEAARILATTEAVTRFGWRLSLSDLRHITRLDVGDAKQSFETDSGRDALAESLAAVLPVLDALEAESRA